MLVFGIPTKRQKAIKELYNKMVITVLSRPDLEGVSYRVLFHDGPALDTFSQKAVTVGVYNDEEKGEQKVFFAPLNIVGETVNVSGRISANGHLNNQRIWNFLREFFAITEAEFQLVLTPTSIDGHTVYVAEKYVHTVDDSPADTQVTHDDTVITDDNVMDEEPMEVPAPEEEEDEEDDSPIIPVIVSGDLRAVPFDMGYSISADSINSEGEDEDCV